MSTQSPELPVITNASGVSGEVYKDTRQTGFIPLGMVDITYFAGIL